jgi:hypothetical protein
MQKTLKKQITTEHTEENIREVLRLLSETPAQLEGLSRGLSDKELHKPLGKGERYFIEAMAHLLNFEARCSDVITLALLAKEPMLTPIHPQRNLGKLLRFDQYPLDELLKYFEFRRRVLLKVLNSLKANQWTRVIREEGKQRKESVYWQARGLALHELEHVQELERKLEKNAWE